ncbi:MAG TPA: DUF1385 domain-containing protein, partial [Limnochordia bacterium]|nr:DUF1385 domain-containing protein [Limnochordia bacterium]
RPPFVWRVLLHLALLPVVAAISYEILKQAGRQGAAVVFDWISRPGMWTQLLTTREPDAAQAEVAIQALNDVLVLDAKDAERAGVRAIGLASSSTG